MPSWSRLPLSVAVRTGSAMPLPYQQTRHEWQSGMVPREAAQCEARLHVHRSATAYDSIDSRSGSSPVGPCIGRPASSRVRRVLAMSRAKNRDSTCVTSAAQRLSRDAVRCSGHHEPNADVRIGARDGLCRVALDGGPARGLEATSPSTHLLAYCAGIMRACSC